MQKKDYILLTVILLLGLFFRLYQIQFASKTILLVATYNNPVADLHSWRQADTAAVARNYTRDGIDLLHPHYDDLTSLESGIENPQGLRYVEFPIYNAMFAWMYHTAPFMSIDAYGRITTAFFSLVIIAIVYYLCLYEENRLAASVAASVYAVFPFFVFFSRVILPETTALAFAMLAILFMYLNSKKEDEELHPIYFILSIICLALSVLAKPTTIFYSITIFYLFLLKYKFTSIKFNIIKKYQIYLYFFLAFAPLAAWRLFITKHPEAIPASSWLIMNVNTYEGMRNIFFRPAFFRWIFYERIANMMFGGFLSTFFVLGIIAKQKRFVLISILVSAAAYLFTFQGGNVQHEYYQTLILPALAIMIGVGVAFLYHNKSRLNNPIIVTAATIIVFILSYFFSYYRISDFYRIPQDLVTISNVIKSITNQNDKIVTDRLGDTTLLYLSDRKGSPAKYKELDEFKKMGYSYFVTQNKDTIAATETLGKYKVVYKNNDFALFKL